MAIQVKHKFVSAKVDTLDNSKVQPSNWNADHDLFLAGGVVVGRPAGGGQAAAQELPMGAMGQTLIATADAAAARAAIVADATETTIQGKAAKATPVDADTVVITDSAAANALKRVTWANIKATLKAYFDTLYLAASYIPTWASILGKPNTIAGYGITDCPITKYFESAQQTLGGGGTRTVAHGFGFRPKFYLAFLQCVANDWNYAVGDEILAPMSNIDAGNNGRDMVLKADAVNIYIQYGNLGTQFINALQWGTGANVLLTSANWRLVVRAWG